MELVADGVEDGAEDVVEEALEEEEEEGVVDVDFEMNEHERWWRLCGLEPAWRMAFCLCGYLSAKWLEKSCTVQSRGHTCQAVGKDEIIRS